MGSAKIRFSSFIILICALGSQLTDVSIGPLKVWEFLAIIVIIFSLRTINKRFMVFFTFFTILLILSILASFFSEAKYDNYGGLKQKYIISIVRYIELMLCGLVAMTILAASKRYGSDPKNLISKFLKYNFFITVLIIFIYCIDFVFKTNFVSYGLSHRLRGFYVEGGPFGLFISTLLFLEMITKKRKIFLFVFFIALVLAQSKAAIAAMGLFTIVITMHKSRFLRSFLMPRNIIRFSFFIVTSVAVSSFVTYNVAKDYIDDINNSSYLIERKGQDKSFVMGRIAAYNIGPKIFIDNPVIGVGLGAYSLVRNDPLYSGNFPSVDDWDLTGLGGLFNLIVENGIIGFLGFIFVTFKFFRFDVMGFSFIILFLTPFVFGAQLYMIYPWIYLGFYASLDFYRKQENVPRH